MTNKKVVIVGAAIAMVLTICALLIGGIYEIQTDRDARAWKINRITGTVTLCEAIKGSHHDCMAVEK